MNTTVKIALSAAIALVTVLAGVKAFSRGSTGDTPTAAASSPSETIFPVTTRTIEPVDLNAYIELNGLVDADNAVEVYPEIGGKYANLRAQLGMKVNKGDVIAEIDPSKPGSPYSLSPVRAPISGTITSLFARQGSTVTTETVVARIGDIEHLQVRLQIPEREIADMRMGLAAHVRVEAYPDVIFPATVYRVSPLVDSASHTKDVFLRFDRDDSRINAGMFARVKLFTRTYGQCIAVPDDSVLSGEGSSFVYAMNADGTVTKREIGCGVSIDGHTIVERGLSRGERIVVQGVSALSDGATVRDIGGSSHE